MITSTRRGSLALVLLAPLAVAGCAAATPEDPVEPEPTVAALEVAGMTPEAAPGCFPDGAQAFTADVDGEELTVVVAGTGEEGILLAPMAQSNHCSWGEETTRLVDAGYVVASFSWVRDGTVSVNHAVDALRAAGVTELVLFGASKGGAYAAGMADDVDPTPVGVIAVGPPEDYEVDARSASSSYTGPLLVIATTDDRSVPIAESRNVARADEPETFVELPGSAHGVSVFIGEHRERSRQVVDDFLDEVFGH